MQTSRILVVEDHEAFRRFIRLALQQRVAFQIIGEVSDGLDAVQKAEELQPNVVLLDIGLPKLNGLEAGRRIRKVSPNSKILFLTHESSSDVVQEALDLGAQGYILKACAQSDLLPAIDAVVRGKRFVSSGLDFTEPSCDQVSHRHELLFYSDDGILLNSLTRFVVAALNVGNAAIALLTESHRTILFQRLCAEGIDVHSAIERGTYVPVDVRSALAMFMVNDSPDAVRLSTAVSDLVRLAKRTSGEQRRVVACGECAPTLWAQGKLEAAIQVERLWNEIVKRHDADTLCVYPLPLSHAEDPALSRICAEHTAVHTDN